MILLFSFGLLCGVGKYFCLGFFFICCYFYFSNGGMCVVCGLVMVEYGKYYGNC